MSIVKEVKIQPVATSVSININIDGYDEETGLAILSPGQGTFISTNVELPSMKLLGSGEMIPLSVDNLSEELLEELPMVFEWFAKAFDYSYENQVEPANPMGMLP